ncbi:MAG: bifunctional nuclease family protein [Muribaculaceae bacterium]|nr:bifunctional nuclease family protein [Muribaculaceae bacterium]
MDSNDRVNLYVLGLSYSQLQSGAYALILAEADGPRRIPVVIGPAEAQSIAIVLEGIRTPRPLTHDLFASFAHAYGIKLTEVFIYRFEDGIFSSEISFSDGKRDITIDSRTSDAIAIALRTRTPIFTTEDILRRTGFVIKDDEMSRQMPEVETFDDAEAHTDDNDGPMESSAPCSPFGPGVESPDDTPRPENYTVEQLEATLAELIESEDYEEAARISEILSRKKATRDNSAAADSNE